MSNDNARPSGLLPPLEAVPRELTDEERRRLYAPQSDEALHRVSDLLSVATGREWQRDKRVLGLWTFANDKIGWIWIDGVGWRQLAYTNSSSFIALTLLAASARVSLSRVDYREESDGLIHELYVW